MHSDDRRRYLIRPLDEIHPGDRVSLDRTALQMVRDDRHDEVDWKAVDADAAVILNRTRPRRTCIDLTAKGAPGGRIRGEVLDEFLVHKPQTY